MDRAEPVDGGLLFGGKFSSGHGGGIANRSAACTAYGCAGHGRAHNARPSGGIGLDPAGAGEVLRNFWP
jgi:hypothetical protein